MKKRIFFCMLLLMIVWGITGCQKADEEIGNTDIDMQETEKIETREMETKEKEKDSPSDAVPSAEDKTNIEDKTYNIEEYGTIEEKRQEYLENGTENVAYYYEMENFFFNDTFSNATSINHTLHQIYDEYEGNYIEEAAKHQSGLYEPDIDEFSHTPYDYWHILSLTYVGDDYISIQYNDVFYMGGAHPYSCFDGITIDCKTGEQVLASQLLGKSDEEILTEISNTMGLDVIATWDDVDFYLTDSSIVFFYRIPLFWDDVVWQREN